MKSEIYIDTISYPLAPSWNNLHILMHNIVLYISIYLFLWFHVLYDLRPINNDRKHAFSAIFISVVFLTLIFDGWSAYICVAMHTMQGMVFSASQSHGSRSARAD